MTAVGVYPTSSGTDADRPVRLCVAEMWSGSLEELRASDFITFSWG